MTVWKYTIPGEPLGWGGAHDQNKNSLDDASRLRKMKAAIYLEQQHGERPFFKGPLSMKLHFYLKGVHEGRLCISGISMAHLIKFVHFTAAGLLYSDNRVISVCESYKFYSRDPRTEIIIEELVNE